MTRSRKQSACVVCLCAILLLASCKNAKPRGFRDGDRMTSYSQQITAPVKEFTVKPGDRYALDITVKNTGTQPWYAKGSVGRVNASYSWLDTDGHVIPTDSVRTSLNRIHVKPGESDEVILNIAAPATRGEYTLWVSMVQEGYDWFYARNTPPLSLRVTVN